MSKYTKFSRLVFKFCDTISQPLCNWGRQNLKDLSYEKDVPYDDHPLCVGDIYYKTELKDTPKPVLIYIHGGGFVGGDKKFRNALSVWYANLGYFVYNINYRVAPEFTFPQAVKDGVSALNFIAENKDKYNLDLDKVVISGDSAGGYYAGYIAAASRSEALQKKLGLDYKVKPYAVVLNCGLYNLETALSAKTIFNMAPKIALDLCGVTVEEFEKYEYREELSSLNYVDENYPKCFLIYAKKDIFCAGQGEVLSEKLKKLGVYVEEYEGKRRGDNHCFPLFWDLKSARECNEKLAKFLIAIKEGKI